MLEERSVHRPREKRIESSPREGRNGLSSRIPGEEKKKKKKEEEEEEKKKRKRIGGGEWKEKRFDYLAVSEIVNIY